MVFTKLILMTCNGVCIRYKAKKPTGEGRYASGQKRCQVCSMFLNWEGFWCPCCNFRLRATPRNTSFKKKFREQSKIQTKVIA